MSRPATPTTTADVLLALAKQVPNLVVLAWLSLKCMSSLSEVSASLSLVAERLARVEVAISGEPSGSHHGKVDTAVPR